jgi:hypothetical protein
MSTSNQFTSLARRSPLPIFGPRACCRLIEPAFVAGIVAAVLIAIVPSAIAQNSRGSLQTNPQSKENAERIGSILGISPLVDEARVLHTQRSCQAPASIEGLSMRQDIFDSVLTASLQVDGVLAELENERAHLSELSAALQARRDRAVNLINIASLITGTGLGIAVNAMQFSASTANAGNGLGVGSGIGSTVLSIIGIRRQGGPHRSVGRIPNMLAPLFGRQAALNSFYPQAVMEYLRSVPPGEAANAGSRLEQLMIEWKQAGRLGPVGSAQNDQKITRLTSSLDDKDPALYRRHIGSDSNAGRRDGTSRVDETRPR